MNNKLRHNDKEREQWVQNDEGLYDLWVASKRGITLWIKYNRKLIDSVIDNVLNGKKPAHYLKYNW
jgi:hypothetical protein